ncbi:MAG: prohibitin family protein [bacterium]|nr:prohibitin family protein [bacterium]
MEIIKSYRKIILFVIILVFVLPLLSKISFFYTVNYGKAAIVSRFGKIERVALPGPHFKLPVVENVDFFSTQKIIYETSEHDDVSKADYKDTPVDTSTEDGQQVSIRYTVRFQLDQSKLDWVALNLGQEAQIVERVVKTNSRSVVRNLARRFRAQDLYTGNVFDFQKDVQASLSASFVNNGLILDEFLVRQITFSEEYVNAVEQKQIENEKVKTEEYKANQETFIKQQKITRSEGEGAAQEILKRSIDPLVLQKMAIEKWDGKLPTYFGSSSPLPFVNIK